MATGIGGGESSLAAGVVAIEGMVEDPTAVTLAFFALLDNDDNEAWTIGAFVTAAVSVEIPVLAWFLGALLCFGKVFPEDFGAIDSCFFFHCFLRESSRPWNGAGDPLTTGQYPFK